jgi:hypothetical protein
MLYLVLISKAGCTLPLHAAESLRSLDFMLSYAQFSREHRLDLSRLWYANEIFQITHCLKEKASLASMAMQMVLLAITHTLATGPSRCL